MIWLTGFYQLCTLLIMCVQSKEVYWHSAKVGKKMPAHVKDSIKRQYKAGTPGAQPYTIEDKKNVINWYKDNK